MVDNMYPSGSQATNEVIAEPSGIGRFVGTRTGRIVIGAVALLIVLGAAAAIAYLFVLQPGTPSIEPVVPPAGSVVPTGTAIASEDATPTLRRAKPLSSTFVFRDVFVPTVKPTFAAADGGTTGGGTNLGGTTGDGTTGDGTTGGGTTGGDGTGDIPSVPEDTLLLHSIVTMDGVSVANLIWNGQVFSAVEGDELGDTPWQVVEIRGNTVVLLFGDTRVTLTVGQGISK